MPRAARVVAVGVPHHITQRGNNRQDIFVVDEDRQQYLKALAEDSARYGIRLLGWCLMTNHVHLVAVPERPVFSWLSGSVPQKSKAYEINWPDLRRFAECTHSLTEFLLVSTPSASALNRDQALGSLKEFSTIVRVPDHALWEIYSDRGDVIDRLRKRFEQEPGVAIGTPEVDVEGQLLSNGAPRGTARDR